MTKTRKVELLHKKAHGQEFNVTPDEKRELSRYKVDSDESYYATKKNISDYITAVDNGSREDFYDWCKNHNKADRRRKGGSEKEMEQTNKAQKKSVMLIGWLSWGIALYWIFNGAIPAGTCAIIGAIVSVVIYKFSRKNAAFTVWILPIILAVIFGTKNL